MDLIKWTIINAFLISVALIFSIFGKTILFLPLVAFASFCLLFWSQRSDISKSGLTFLGSYANQITAFRFVLCGIIAIFHSNLPDKVIFFIIGWAIFLDGIDGYVARRYKQESNLGALFDKTVDAFFVLLVSFLLVQEYQIPSWFLIIGYMHYGYELLMHFLNWSNLEIPRNPIGKLVAVILFISLLSPFILPKYWYLTILYLTTLLTCLSFGWSFWAKYQVANNK